MEYLNLSKKEMMDLIRELMWEQRLDPQDFIEISLNYASDEKMMAYSKHESVSYMCDYVLEDDEINDVSKRKKCILKQVYEGGCDFDDLVSFPLMFEFWEKEKIIEFCEKENISYIFTKEFLYDPDRVHSLF
jgi:hypothetical protein